MTSVKLTFLFNRQWLIKIQYILNSGSSAEARISEHLNKIKKYKKNKNILENGNNGSLILYNHFKNDDHEIKEHFTLSYVRIF